MTLNIPNAGTAALQRQSQVSDLHRGKLEVNATEWQEETHKLGTSAEITMKPSVFCHIASHSAAVLLANKDTNSHAAPSL